MDLVGKKNSAVSTDTHEDVNIAAVITVIALVLVFIGAGFYLVIDSYIQASS